MAGERGRKEGRSPKRPGQEPILREAIEDAAEKLGKGTHDVRVDEIWATVEVTNPGQVREYRVIVSD